MRPPRPPRPPELTEDLDWPREGGVLFKGAKGILMCGVYGNGVHLLPQSLHQSYVRPPKTLPRVRGSHEMDWVRACQAGKPAGAHFGYSGPLTEMCALGNVAKRVDAPIEWDAAHLQVTNRPQANQLIRTTYRQGWQL